MLCESCNYDNSISICNMCDKHICSSCIEEGGFCVWCLNDDNSMLAMEDYLRNKKKKVRWFRVDSDTNTILPIRKSRFCFWFK